jgi:hypothetical protein
METFQKANGLQGWLRGETSVPARVTVEYADHIFDKKAMISIYNSPVWWHWNSNLEKIVEIMDASFPNVENTTERHNSLPACKQEPNEL